MARAAKRSNKQTANEPRAAETARGFQAIPRPITHALLIAGVVLLAFAAYSNSFLVPFLVDNDSVILQDNRIYTVTSDHIHRILTQPYSLSSVQLYRPLTTLSFMFNYAVLGNGSEPAGYHWFNFILHSVNIALVYGIGIVLFGQIPAALILSALWGLHPVLTESVTNIVGRADMFAAFAVFAALLCHWKALRARGLRKAAWVAAITLCVAIGVSSKESAIVAIAVIVLYDLTFGRYTSWRSSLPSYLAVLAPSLVFLIVRARVLASVAYVLFPFTDNPLVGADFWTARVTAIKVLGRYFQLLLWPAQLSYDYSYNEIPAFTWTLASWEDWKAMLSILACMALAAVALRSYRRQKPLFFAIVFFFVTISPASNLVILIGSIMAERFLYLPSAGFAIALVWALSAIWRRLPAQGPVYRYTAVAVLSLTVIAAAVRTDARNREWMDPQRFLRSAAEASPGSFKTHLGATKTLLSAPALHTQADWDRSAAEVRRGLVILDKLPDIYNSGTAYRYAGLFYRLLGDNIAAKAGSRPEHWYRESRDALLRSERIELAQEERSRAENATRGKPAGLSFLPSALYLQMGRTYMKLGEPRRAIEAFERGRALQADPDLLEGLASAYSEVGDPRNSARSMIEAMAVDPARARSMPMLLEAYEKADPGGCAVSRQGGRPSLNLQCPLVHDDICAASKNVVGTYLRHGQTSDAAALRSNAIRELGCSAESLN